MTILISSESFARYQARHGVEARIAVENLVERLSEAQEEITGRILYLIAKARGIGNGFSHAGHHKLSACEWVLTLANSLAYDQIILQNLSTDRTALSAIERADFAFVILEIRSELLAVDAHPTGNWEAFPPCGIHGLVSELASWNKEREAIVTQSDPPTDISRDGILEKFGEITSGLLIADSTDSKPRKMTWKDAQIAAEKHLQRNPWPGLKALANLVGCSAATMSKARDNSPLMRKKETEYNSERKLPRPRQFAPAQFENLSKEDDVTVGVDELFENILSAEQDLKRRATLEALTPQKRRQLVSMLENDPDGEGWLDRKPTTVRERSRRE